MGNLPILSLITFLPLLGAAFILSVRGEPDVVARNVRNVALLTSGTTFVLSLGLWLLFDPSVSEFQFVEHGAWMPAFGISYHMGVDGISSLCAVVDSFDSHLHSRQLGKHHRPGQGIHDCLFSHGDHACWDVLRA